MGRNGRRQPGRPAWWQVYDAATVLLGAVLAVRTFMDVDSGLTLPAILSVLVTALMVRVPVRIARADGGIEIGLDSAVLVFLLLVTSPHDAVAVWIVGQILGQVISRKSLSTKLFNAALGAICGFVTAAVAGPLGLHPGIIATSPSAVVPVMAAAIVCFLADYLLTVVSLLIFRGWGHLTELRDPTLPLSLTGFAIMDTLGLLAAAIYWRAAHWTLLLLAAPIAGLLAASWAYSRNKEQQAILTGLLTAAELVYAAEGVQSIVDTLVSEASSVLLAENARLQEEPPGEGEIGTRVGFLPEPTWLVCGRRVIGRSYDRADQQALDGLVQVAYGAAERTQLLSTIAFEALHDPVTRLGNRSQLLRELAAATAEPRAEVALVYLDLDGFKEINDTLGHHAGDHVLKVVAGRLAASVREGDLVARLGGDEFAVVVRGGDLACTVAAQAMLDAVRSPVELDSLVTLQVRASAGVVCWNGESPEDLLRNADLAMYAAKRDGKDRWRVFEAEMLERELARVELERDLGYALESDPDQLTLHYQPLVDLQTGEVTGLEALLRWRHPVRGMVPPLEFIPVAENTGLIHQLGRWVVTQAYSDAMRWVSRVGRPLMMSVNVSPRQLEDRTFVQYVVDLVRSTGPDVRLVLELTESAFVAGERMMDALHALHAAGVHLAIDDFGTGYSALSYLRDLPVDHLKVDRSFVRDIADDARSASLVEVIHGVARSLGLTIIAEGVETPEQAATLAELGCPFGQGYLFSRPVPAEQVEGLLRRVLTVESVA